MILILFTTLSIIQISTILAILGPPRADKTLSFVLTPAYFGAIASTLIVLYFIVLTGSHLKAFII
jgi:hypothetical protein